MARFKGIANYGTLIVKNQLHTISVLCSPQPTKILRHTTSFHILPTTTTACQPRRAFCDLTGNQQPLPPPSTSNWGKWAAGMVVTVGISLLQFKEKVDVVVETAEEIIDVVQVVAEAVDMVAEKIADDLPDDSKLKTSVELVEELAETVSGKAQKAVDFIDEVQEAEQKLGPIVEPIKQLTQVDRPEAT